MAHRHGQHGKVSTFYRNQEGSEVGYGGADWQESFDLGQVRLPLPRPPLTCWSCNMAKGKTLFGWLAERLVDATEDAVRRGKRKLWRADTALRRLKAVAGNRRGRRAK